LNNIASVAALQKKKLNILTESLTVSFYAESAWFNRSGWTIVESGFDLAKATNFLSPLKFRPVAVL
jgi:hypothetical protein